MEIELLRRDHPGVLSCDGRRSIDLPPGSRVRVRKSAQPIAVARLLGDTFAERLVEKFGLPVQGFRDAARAGRRDPHDREAVTGRVDPEQG